MYPFVVIVQCNGLVFGKEQLPFRFLHTRSFSRNNEILHKINCFWECKFFTLSTFILLFFKLRSNFKQMVVTLSKFVNNFSSFLHAFKVLQIKHQRNYKMFKKVFFTRNHIDIDSFLNKCRNVSNPFLKTTWSKTDLGSFVEKYAIVCAL